jgi:hypothetical protein
MIYNSDFKYDLQIGQNYETSLYELLGKRIEVKRDFKCLETGNIFIEYESRGKKSGIATSEAEWWCYWLSDFHLVLIELDKLKIICRQYLNTNRDVRGGDMNTSKGILLPVKTLFENTILNNL